MKKSIFFDNFFMFYNIFLNFFLIVLILILLFHCETLKIASLPVYGEMAFVAEWYKTFGMIDFIIKELVTIVMK